MVRRSQRRLQTGSGNHLRQVPGSPVRCLSVGGGGKIRGFEETLAQALDLPEERVALRGSEVMGQITFLQKNIKKDSLLVTPVGICLNYYEQKKQLHIRDNQ